MTTWVYKHFDDRDVLLYVGVTNSPGTRGGGHAENTDWFEHIARTTYTRFERRTPAEIEEARLIREERPVHNLNGGTNTAHYENTPSETASPDSRDVSSAPKPRYLLPRERVVETLRNATKPLSMEEIRRRTSGKTQAIRDAVDEVVARGEAISVRGTNGYRVVLAGREHLLVESVTTITDGTLPERILAALTAAGEPIPVNEIIRRTRGKSVRIRSTIGTLLREGTIVETRGPRRGRHIALSA